MKKRNILMGLLLCSAQWMMAQESLSLAGTWRFQTDPMGFGKTPGSELYLSKLTESIQLPGSMDEGGKGMSTTARYVDRLTRKFEYCGPAWYQREVIIPQSWSNKDILLHLERCHWETTVFVDGQLAGSQEHLSTPNCFNLTQWLTPGVHTLTVCVDNRLKYPMDQWNHGTTEYTQTNWNGMVGDLKLIAHEKTHIQRLQIYPEVKNQAAQLQLTLQNTSQQTVSGQLELVLKEKNGPVVRKKTLPVEMKVGDQTITHTFQLGKNLKLWNEFTPHLYEVNATLKVDGREDRQTQVFGMRQVTQGKHHIQVNGRNIHLRGTLDCCVFPLTGYPSTDAADWKRIFLTVKDYGMNHIRFHSWCPPEAAFEAADEVGIYLQAELPMWIKDVGQYPARRNFFEKEMYAILETYGNHPSFILMCNGNENEGNFAVLEDLVKKAQQHDNRRLYSASTARTHTASDQYYVSHVTDKGWITVYEGQPSTDWDRSKESAIDCPVIAHETGQRCMYPNFQEMKKYTGVVTPRNFEVFRERLARNGMLHQADDFFRATGAHTVLQYKEVNESLLRTANSGGFQLLGLSDFPGQGSAFVGILDAFWESKGLVSPEKFRESCAPTVLLARLPKRAFTTDETGTAKLEIYHYGELPIRKGHLEWSLKNSQGKTLHKGKLSVPAISCATVDPLGEIRFDFKDCHQAEKLTLHATLNNNFHNEWDIWVYPNSETQEQSHTNKDYVMANTYDEHVREALRQGKKVLLVPEKKMGRKTHFAGHFWNPIMFNWDPMIVGTLIQHEHPAFRNFPTDAHADWQWWDILNYAHALQLDGCPELTPLIQSIDSYEYNQKLGIAFEAQVEKGKLFVLNVDIHKDLDQRPATRQLLRSIQNYVASDDFRPEVILPLHRIDSWLTPIKSTEKKNSAENAAIEQLLNQ
ncbi:glycoside hydrolase family 2 protein [uncultured Prevotella sp.]|uniref:glycoside hydrolase family 2 protein n=1 Tax=uncultured Prevotella sp. TaxID=159272 RepID=UPI00266FBA4A|nr:sugar-binding domain-containing protein [uncultured Prevotella sp.]